MGLKINDKTRLKDVLYKEGFDTVYVNGDGTWSTASSDSDLDTPVTLHRKYHHDLSKNDVNYLVKAMELKLNNEHFKGTHASVSHRITGYDYSDGREEIQEKWQKHVK